MKFKIKNLKFLKAQSLIELLVAVAIGTILIGGSVGLMGVSIKSYGTVKKHLQANVLIRESAEVIQSLARNSWHNIYDLTKGTDYKISLSGNFWTISAGQETSTVNNVPYKRYFKIYDVNRDGSGDITDIGDDDPSTQKITIILEYGDNYVSSSSISFYFTRSDNNSVFHQTDWAGESGITGPIPNPVDKYDTSTNITTSTAGQITMATTTSDGTLISSILDTGVSVNAGFNSFLWQGSLGTGGAVKFQIAFSNSPSGPWTYYGPTSEADWYQPNPNVSISFPTAGSASPQNKKYMRYKVNLSTTGTSPRIDDIIINWSP
ncbi:hypothetical protein D4R86_00215 [bacterium]|nr:MAG: hypothetical protein D4R86_00215 [bacterium]